MKWVEEVEVEEVEEAMSVESVSAGVQQLHQPPSTNRTLQPGARHPGRHYNGTGYYVDNDDADTSKYLFIK